MTTPTDTNVHPDDVKRLTGQNAELLAWLQRGDKVTPRDAYEHGITRLAARVFDLRRQGYDVKMDYHSKLRCAVYWMEPVDK